MCGFLSLRLENTAVLLADELNAQQALGIVEALEEIQSRNLSLLNKWVPAQLKQWRQSVGQ